MEFWTQLSIIRRMHHMEAELAIAIMLFEMATRHGELHRRLHDPCIQV